MLPGPVITVLLNGLLMNCLATHTLASFLQQETGIPGPPAEAAAGLAVAHLAVPGSLAGCLPLPGSQTHCVRGLVCVPWGAQGLGEGRCRLALGMQIQIGDVLRDWGVGEAAAMMHPARRRKPQ